jgi:hypothetical protein
MESGDSGATDTSPPASPTAEGTGLLSYEDEDSNTADAALPENPTDDENGGAADVENSASPVSPRELRQLERHADLKARRRQHKYKGSAGSKRPFAE